MFCDKLRATVLDFEGDTPRFNGRTFVYALSRKCNVSRVEASIQTKSLNPESFLTSQPETRGSKDPPPAFSIAAPDREPFFDKHQDGW